MHCVSSMARVRAEANSLIRQSDVVRLQLARRLRLGLRREHGSVGLASEREGVRIDACNLHADVDGEGRLVAHHVHVVEHHTALGNGGRGGEGARAGERRDGVKSRWSSVCCRRRVGSPSRKGERLGPAGKKASEGPLYCHALVMFQCRKRAGDPCVVMHLSGSVGSTILPT